MQIEIVIDQIAMAGALQLRYCYDFLSVERTHDCHYRLRDGELAQCFEGL